MKLYFLLSLLIPLVSYAQLPPDYVSVKLPVLAGTKLTLKERISFESGQKWTSGSDKNMGSYVLRSWIERSTPTNETLKIPPSTTFTLLDAGRNTSPKTAHGYAPAVGHDGGITLFLKGEEGHSFKFQIYRIDRLNEIPGEEDLKQIFEIGLHNS